MTYDIDQILSPEQVIDALKSGYTIIDKDDTTSLNIYDYRHADLETLFSSVWLISSLPKELEGKLRKYEYHANSESVLGQTIVVLAHSLSEANEIAWDKARDTVYPQGSPEQTDLSGSAQLIYYDNGDM